MRRGNDNLGSNVSIINVDSALNGSLKFETWGGFVHYPFFSCPIFAHPQDSTIARVDKRLEGSVCAGFSLSAGESGSSEAVPIHGKKEMKRETSKVKQRAYLPCHYGPPVA